jgi:hypothetical protein
VGTHHAVDDRDGGRERANATKTVLDLAENLRYAVAINRIRTYYWFRSGRIHI